MYLLPTELQSYAYIVPIGRDNQDFSQNQIYLFNLHALYTSLYNQPATVNLTFIENFGKNLYWTTLLSRCFDGHFGWWLLSIGRIGMKLFTIKVLIEKKGKRSNEEQNRTQRYREQKAFSRQLHQSATNSFSISFQLTVPVCVAHEPLNTAAIALLVGSRTYL